MGYPHNYGVATMFTAFGTLFRGLNELFMMFEIFCRSGRKGAELCETLVDNEIAEAQAKALAE
jgi:hypothetical protein